MTSRLTTRRKSFAVTEVDDRWDEFNVYDFNDVDFSTMMSNAFESIINSTNSETEKVFYPNSKIVLEIM